MNISPASSAAPLSSTAPRPPADPKPPAEYPSAFLNYRTKTDLRIPLEGTWQVLWGGRDVHTGDTVAQGYPLGRTGNSGNSTEPHLHYHLQNSPAPFEGDGLPAQFHSVRNARPQEVTGD